MTSKDKREDPETFEQGIREICATYHEAVAPEANGTHVVSCDEKTGIQALERKQETLPTRAGLIERREHEYARHGTLCLIANFFVATGRVLYSTVGLTRTEKDFSDHVRNTVASDPKAQWVFVVDQLNTHMSEELVRLVAGLCEVGVDLGDKGKRGVLKSMKSRRTFLSDASHRIRFQYTPRHCDPQDGGSAVKARTAESGLVDEPSSSPSGLRRHPCRPGTRDLIQHSRSTRHQTRKLLPASPSWLRRWTARPVLVVHRRPSYKARGFHRLFQRGPRQTFSLDLLRKTTQSLTTRLCEVLGMGLLPGPDSRPVPVPVPVPMVQRRRGERPE